MLVSKPSLGYVGLGNMGHPMAMRLAKAGYRLNVFARKRAVADSLLAAGATASGDAQSVAANSDIVFLCLTDTKAVEQVVFDKRGIAAGAKKGALLIDMSTIAPDATVEMAGRLQRASEMRWLDMPVSGGTIGATEGTLTIFAGGAQEDFERALPVLRELGKNINLLGPVGAGQTTKLINQVVVACSVMMLAEAVGLAQSSGLNLERLPKALEGGRADSAALRHYAPRLIDWDFTPLGNLKSIVKDIDLIQQLGGRNGAALPMTGLVRSFYQLLINAGHAHEDLTALARLFVVRSN